MTKRIGEILATLECGMRIQRDCIPCTHENYMQGLYNGMAWAHSIIDETNPHYIMIKKTGKRNRVRYGKKKIIK
jgi:hypothetical protein